MKRILLIVLFAGLISCSEDKPLIEEPQVEADLKIMRELAIATGNSMQNQYAKEQVINLIKAKTDDSESIGFSTLLGKNDRYKKNELKHIDKKIIGKNNNSFRDTFIEHIISNKETFPILMELMDDSNYNLTQKTTGINLENFNSEKYQLYFPYSENFDTENISEYTTSYHPIVNEDKNEGFKYSLSSKSNTNELKMEEVDDDYAYRNPSLLIIPIDDVDGSEFSNTNEGSGGGNPITGGFLTTNVDHTTISQKDVVKVIIPKIKITKQTSGIFQPTRLTIYRASGDLKFGSDGLLLPSATSYRLLYKKHVKRRDIRKKRWKTVNLTFDGDWDVHENTQQIVVFTHHTFKGSVDVKGSVKIGWDKEKNQATFEPTASVDFSLKNGNCKLRYNNEISRRDVLSHLVGDTGAGTYYYKPDKTSYSKRKAGIMDYFFRVYYTDIPE